jgi:hypothetical protein
VRAEGSDFHLRQEVTLSAKKAPKKPAAKKKTAKKKNGGTPGEIKLGGVKKRFRS